MFSENIKQLRENNQLTKIQFARMIGVSAQMVSNWENKKTIPSGKTLLKISKHYNISIDFLLGISDSSKVSLEGLYDESVNLVLKLIEKLRKKEME